MFNRLPGLARFLLALTAINLAVFAAFRGIFWAAFHEALASASSADLRKALYLGLKFDLRLTLLLCLPLALIGWPVNAGFRGAGAARQRSRSQ